MLKTILTASLLAAGVALVAASTASASFPVAQAKLSSPTADVTPAAWHGHHHFRRGIFIGVPFYGYAYGGGCGWLRDRAFATGSRYWWHRYHACRYGW
jgi:hypothetical protein